jgi:hypothetical protein
MFSPLSKARRPVLNELSNGEEDIMTHRTKTDALNPELANDKIERIYHDWDAALSSLEELPPGNLKKEWTVCSLCAPKIRSLRAR